MDLTNSISGGRGFYVGELQSGYGVHGTIIGSPVTSSDFDMWAWGMVARGARAINFYAFYPMNAGYESGGYGLINLDGRLTGRSIHAGEIARRIQENSDLLLQSHPEPAEAAIIFNPLLPLLGGYDEQGSRTAIHQAVAGYHRMFFERNLPLDVLSSRELSQSRLQLYKLVIVPYPLMMTSDEAHVLKRYVEDGGHLFVEARPGWVDDRGYAEPKIPGFGWDQMLGVLEKELIPEQELTIKWGSQTFKSMAFLERFDPQNSSAKAVAYSADGTPVAFESNFGKGSTIVIGSFVGQENYREAIEMHPLAAILADWAHLTKPALHAPALLELREMQATSGRFVFLLNHGQSPATVEFTRALEKPASRIREIASAQEVRPTGTSLTIRSEVPAQAVRIYRIDY
jgi:beta-galactosidase